MPQRHISTNALLYIFFLDDWVWGVQGLGLGGFKFRVLG